MDDNNSFSTPVHSSGDVVGGSVSNHRGPGSIRPQRPSGVVRVGNTPVSASTPNGSHPFLQLLPIESPVQPETISTLHCSFSSYPDGVLSSETSSDIYYNSESNRLEASLVTPTNNLFMGSEDPTCVRPQSPPETQGSGISLSHIHSGVERDSSDPSDVVLTQEVPDIAVIMLRSAMSGRLRHRVVPIQANTVVSPTPRRHRGHRVLNDWARYEI